MGSEGASSLIESVIHFAASRNRDLSEYLVHRARDRSLGMKVECCPVSVKRSYWEQMCKLLVLLWGPENSFLNLIIPFTSSIEHNDI